MSAALEPPALRVGARVYCQTPHGIKLWGRVVEVIEAPCGHQVIVAPDGCPDTWGFLDRAVHVVPDGLDRARLADGGYA